MGGVSPSSLGLESCRAHNKAAATSDEVAARSCPKCLSVAELQEQSVAGPESVLARRRVEQALDHPA